jgi:predicted GIY-YIG superfamily endonuclease
MGIREEASHSNSDQRFFYVYLLRSESDPTRVYVGITDHLDHRLSEHNAGKAKHTSKYRPWRIETYLAFTDHQMAVAFERYLKTSSGIAFARKRLRAS